MESGWAGVLPRLTAPQHPTFQHPHVVQHQHKHRSLSLLGLSTSTREYWRELMVQAPANQVHLHGETETSRIEKYGTALGRNKPTKDEGIGLLWASRCQSGKQEGVIKTRAMTIRTTY